MSEQQTQQKPENQTRLQRMYGNAYESVASVPKDLRKDYKRVCQNFPVLVRSCGLCQALAFMEAKRSGDDSQARAYKLLKRHLGSALQKENLIAAGEDPVEKVPSFDTRKYAHATRLILAASVYYKRFAEAMIS